MLRPFAGLCLIALAGCASSEDSVAVYAPPQGINQVLEGPIAAIPRHYHHGEEYIYVLGGSATVSRAGHPDVTLGPGQGIVIPPGVVHWGKAGAEGLRSISAWVKDDARPLREAAP
jgi:uncharacterized RmlC-like cupin family protein